MQIRRILPAALVLFALMHTARPLPAQAETSPPAFGVEEFLAVPMLSAPALSPDGKRAVYVQVVRDAAKDAYVRTLHLVDLAGGTELRLTGKDHSDWGPFWSKDGSTLYFHSSRGGKTALWASRLDGADPVAVAGPREGGVAAPAFSPDGGTLAFLAPPKRAENQGKGPRVLEGIEDPAEWPQLWLLDRASGKERQLTDGKSYIFDFDWAPDGKRLAVITDPRGGSGVTEDHRLGLIDREGKLEILADPPAWHQRPRFSPDGRKLAFLRDRHIENGYYVNVSDLFVLDLETRASAQLTAGAAFDLDDGEWFEWSPDGRWIWFLAGEKARRGLYRVAASGGPAELIGRMETGSVVSVSLAAGAAAFTASDFANPADLFASSLEKWEPRRLTRVREETARFGLRRPLALSWSAPDGLAVEGFLFLPPAAGEKAPLVVEIHGGPAACWNDMFSHRYLWHVFAAKGWATLLPNIRGSRTYGEEFLKANLADFGGGDFSDVMSGVEAALRTGAIDQERLGISGYSYGGFMVNLAVTKTTAFRAAVSIAGGFNFLSCYGQTNPVLPEVYYDPMGSPEKLRRAFEASPVAAVHNVRTPVLLMSGTDDTAVHYLQSMEFFTCLQALGRTSKLILYPGEGHGINKPTHMKHYMRAEIDWLQKHMAEAAPGGAGR